MFRREVPKPPPGRAGRIYPTIEARCRACEIHGGEEPPCRPEGQLERFAEVHDRPCPYVALEPSNALLPELVFYLMDERLRGLAPALWADLAAGLATEDRRALLLRVGRALGSPEVVERFYPELKRAAAARTRPPIGPPPRRPR